MWSLQCVKLAGTAIIYTIMNSTYTYSSHYRTTVNNLSRSSEASDKVLLIQRQTFRTRGPASIDLPVQCVLFFLHMHGLTAVIPCSQVCIRVKPP